MEEQWWISGIRYGSCSNWFVEVSFHLINQVFCFWLILFLTDFFTSYAGNHQGVQKVAFHQQYAPQQIGLDQWQQRQDTSCCHWSTSKSGKEIIISDLNSAKYRISSYSCRVNYSFLKVRVRKVFKGGNYSREETIVILILISIPNEVKNYLHKLISVVSDYCN